MIDTKNIRMTVQAFAESMELELLRNDHKGGWGCDNFSALLARLREEVEEAQEALVDLTARIHVAGEVPDFGNALSELADVGNFAMMLHDRVTKQRAEYEAGKLGKS